MFLSEEEISWNDHYLLSVSNPLKEIRTEAEYQILNRAKTDSNYILVLLEYSTLRIDNNTAFSMAHIVICKIIAHFPNYCLQLLPGFQLRLLATFNAIKDIPGSRGQFILSNSVNTLLKLLIKLKQSGHEELNDNLLFFENLISESMNEINTLPFAFYTRHFYRNFSHLQEDSILSVIQRIIGEYFPITNDFNLVMECIKYFCKYTSKMSIFSEFSEKIFLSIFEFASNSNKFDLYQFKSFWSAIQDININRSEPFMPIVINLMKELQYCDLRMVLFDFCEQKVSLIKPEQVPFLIECFFTTILNGLELDFPNFSFLSSLAVVDFNSLDYIYNCARQILSKNTQNAYVVYLSSVLSIIESHERTEHILPEVIENCMNLCILALQNNLIDIINLTLYILAESLCFVSVPIVNKIPEYLINLTEQFYYSQYVSAILSAIASKVPYNIDIHYIFDKLMGQFCSHANDINPYNAAHYFLVLSSYLPAGRLFPEEKYNPIRELVIRFLPSFNNTTKKKRILAISLSIFISKIYVIDQENYKDILIPAIKVLCSAVSYDVGLHILDLASQEIIHFTKLFKQVAFDLFKEMDYYSQLYQTLFSNEASINFSHPYMTVLSYICKYDRTNFQGRYDFTKKITCAILSSKDSYLTLVIQYANKFIYQALNKSFFDVLLNAVKLYVNNSIQTMNINKLKSYISIYFAIIKPSHISRRMEAKDQTDQINLSFVQELIDVATTLISLSLKEKNYFINFLDPIFNIMIALCPYNCDIIHSFYSLFFQYFNLQQENCNIKNMISETDYFMLLGNSMMDSKIIQAEEIQMMVSLYQKILTDPELIEIYADAYISMSHLVLVEPEFIRPFIELLCQHWKTISDEYVLNILCALFLMIFSKINDSKENQTVIELVIEINDRFTPTIENCNYFIEASLEFLNNYPNIPLAVKERFFHSYVIYISYQKYASNIFKVKQNNHDKLIDKIRELIQEIPTWKEIFESCFPGSPRALRGSLEMIGIPIETNPNPDQKI